MALVIFQSAVSELEQIFNRLRFQVELMIRCEISDWQWKPKRKTKAESNEKRKEEIKEILNLMNGERR